MTRPSLLYAESVSFDAIAIAIAGRIALQMDAEFLHPAALSHYLNGEPAFRDAVFIASSNPLLIADCQLHRWQTKPTSRDCLRLTMEQPDVRGVAFFLLASIFPVTVLRLVPGPQPWPRRDVTA